MSKEKIEMTKPTFKTIKLTRGFNVLVDVDMFDLLSQFKWRVISDKKNFYATTSLSRKISKSVGISREMQMHHLVIGRPINGFVVDHINNKG